MRRPATPLVAALLLAAACSSTPKTSTGRTERETDSVIGNSKLPNAGAVKRASAVGDSAAARTAAQDSVARAE